MSVATTILQLKSELPSNVTLVAVSKFHPAESVMEAYNAGQRCFGESRPQELAAKALQVHQWLHSRGLQDDIDWHFIGHLQTNKLKLVLPYVTMVQSVDSVRLLDAIEKWEGQHDSEVDVLLEYHVAEEITKQGFSAQEIRDILSDKTSKYPHIRFRGLMGMATNTDNEDVIHSDFERIKTLFGELKALVGQTPQMTERFDTMSFGMSSDYQLAVEMGSDMVRIGTMIFGTRE